MPPQEILWRLLEKTKKLMDKYIPHGKDSCISPPEKKIFLLTAHWDNKIIGALFSQKTKYHLSIADQAVTNQLIAFGIEVSHGKKIEWFLDPVTQKFWPKKFWGDINYRDKTLGGVKFVWEINRLYFFVSLGISYRLTKNKKYADKFIWFIRSWTTGNPYPIGINWASGIEVGIRLANLVWALSFFEDHFFSQDDQKAINSFVKNHGTHLHRYPSKYSSSNNHLLAEGFGLFIAGLYFPHLNHSKKWFTKGKKILDNEVSRQILDDGGSFEFSTTYLSFVADFFLLYKISCDTCGIEYNQAINERLEKSCGFIKSIMDVNRNIPNIGDQDSAVLVNFGLSNLENFSSILNTGSLLFSRKDLSTEIPDLKTWILTGHKQVHPKASALKQKADNTPNESKKDPEIDGHGISQLHRKSGLAVIRGRINRKEFLLIGNAMPMGMAPLYAHGHLDALSFTLSVGGLEFFIDPGTYRYHSGGKWRTYFRSTAAHNTIRINQQDMSEQIGDFMFGKPYQITENRLENNNGSILWRAGVKAELKKNQTSAITRQIKWKQNQLIISDYIETQDTGLIECFFHIHPLCSVKNKTGGEIHIQRNGIKIIVLPDSRGKIEIFKGSHDPIAGWYSGNFNEIQESTSIRFYKTLNNKERIITQLSVELDE